jgi:rod shape determining protein RodA
MSSRSFQGADNKMDSVALMAYVGLVIIGFVNVYSASAVVDQEIFEFSTVAKKQLVFMASAGMIALFLSYANVRLIDYFSFGFYAIAIALNIAVLFVGKEVAGAKSWFGFGGFGIQPSEFAKVATALALSKFLGTYGVRFKGWKNVSISLLLFLLPMGLILLQNDTGSALVFLAFFFMLYREGLPGYILVSAIWLGFLAIVKIYLESLGISYWYEYGILAGVASLVVYFARTNKQLIRLTVVILSISLLYSAAIGWFYNNILQQYQRDRIELVLQLKEDRLGVGFNLEQSKIAIGAGQFAGRGFMEGTQTKMGFVPEQHTDFIFCTIGEEWGLLGVLIFFFVYGSLLMRLVLLSERQTTTSARVMGYSAASILFVHFAINIGMTIGIVPVIGIPLPFISAGGSSLWAFTLLLFTFLRMDQKRK